MTYYSVIHQSEDRHEVKPHGNTLTYRHRKSPFTFNSLREAREKARKMTETFNRPDGETVYIVENRPAPRTVEVWKNYRGRSQQVIHR